MRHRAALLGILAACSPGLEVDRGLVATCAAAGECPDGFVCIVELGECRPLGADCVAAAGNGYVAAPDGNACSTGDGAPGICVHGSCGIAFCGDGFQSPGEACDDGEANN